MAIHIYKRHGYPVAFYVVEPPEERSCMLTATWISGRKVLLNSLETHLAVAFNSLH